MINEFVSTFDYKLIYIFRINDAKHNGCLKIGEATVHTSKSYKDLPVNCHDLNYAAKKRIDSYTATAGIVYELLHTEIAVYDQKQKDGSFKRKSFSDHQVHNVLKRSGIKNRFFDTNANQNEWFETDLNTAKNAINAVKNNLTALPGYQITNDSNPIVFRPEQEKAINDTIARFAVDNHMLWNAKMRFGKTLTALEVIKRMKFEKTIIITHRPVVDEGWFNDFKKIFYEKDTKYNYGSKNNGLDIKTLIKSKGPFVYFASIQDLRGSVEVGGKFEKNDDVFGVQWDFVVTDEAHEGTQTELGKKVRDKLINTKNKELSLSGTPFNLFDQYSNDNTYTWDYIMEQQAKYDWIRDPNKLGDHNPYEELPKMNLFTYHLEEQFSDFIDLEDKAFNFREFFRVWTGDQEKDLEVMPAGKSVGDFVHEEAVKGFLDLLCLKNNDTNYPFSTDEYRDYFRHTLWMIPGVKEGRALEKLLLKHPVFKNFKIVNVAGAPDKDLDKELAHEKTALDKLHKAIGKNPENSYTITISCGRLTTGVTVPEWTAVLMLAGSYVTDAKQYLQTIFRVQSPANINGKIKENCYVFDFAPDRTLRVVHDAVKKMSVKRVPPISIEKLMGAFLNFCPVIALDSSAMIEYKAEQLLQEIKRVYAERVVDSGFEDSKLYNDELMRLDGLELEKFEKLQKIIGQTKQTKRPGEVNVADNGLTDEQYEELEKLKKKPKKKLTAEDKKRLEELRKLRDQKNTAISILRGISIRIPLLVYGLDKDIDFDIKIDEFADLVDDNSWAEFMPEGVTKAIFKDFVKYYDKDIFIASCRKIRAISKQCDDLEPTERIKQLVKLFNRFKNPDKETVLTPWNVVNLHMSETIGGYDFFDDTHERDHLLDEPRFTQVDLTTDEVLNKDSHVLEINSKTGLYPLYITYSIYRKFLETIDESKRTFDEKLKIWDRVVDENVFVVCKTKMAKLITKRTLVGYRDKKINSHTFDDLIMQFKEKPEKFVAKIENPAFWGKGGKKMKFNAVVGNPPYQGTNHSQIYPYFYLTSILIGDNVSLIFPTGWQEPKNGNNLAKLNNEKVKKDKQIVFIDNRQNVFPGIMGAEWTNIILWKKDFDNGLNGSQYIFTNGLDKKITDLIWEKSEVQKPDEIKKLGEIVCDNENFISAETITSTRKPFPLLNKKPPLISSEPKNGDDLIISNYSGKKYITKDQITKYKQSAIKLINSYKVFIPYAWGNWSDNYLGGAYADILIAKPGELCFDDTYLVAGPFDTYMQAVHHAKYLMTHFARALLFINKFSQHSTTAWHAVALQDFKESWWDKTIAEIDDELFKKYNVPDNVKIFCKKQIQTRSEQNIINYFDTAINYECKDNDSLAIGNYDSTSMFIIHKGSRVSDHLAPSFQQYDKTNYDLRIKCEKDGTIKDRKLTKDMQFTSQSAATAFITGHIANGSEWAVKK